MLDPGTTKAPPGSRIDRVSYAMSFAGPTRTLLRALKYDHRLSLSRELAGVTAPEARRLAGGSVDAVVPVPLHRSRRRERGFNQSELLTRALAEILGLPVQCALVRVRATRTQTDLTRRERLRNVSGAFAAPSRLDGARLLVVDDVVTTGATMAAACAAALDAGASEAVGLAVAGTPDGDEGESG